MSRFFFLSSKLNSLYLRKAKSSVSYKTHQIVVKIIAVNIGGGGCMKTNIYEISLMGIFSLYNCDILVVIS